MEFARDLILDFPAFRNVRNKFLSCIDRIYYSILLEQPRLRQASTGEPGRWIPGRVLPGCLASWELWNGRPRSWVISQVGYRGQLSHGAEKWPFQRAVGSKWVRSEGSLSQCHQPSPQTLKLRKPSRDHGTFSLPGLWRLHSLLLGCGTLLYAPGHLLFYYLLFAPMPVSLIFSSDHIKYKRIQSPRHSFSPM